MASVKGSRKNSLIICFVMLVICGLLCLLPDEYLNVTSTFPRVQVRVDSVDNSMLDAVGITYNGVQPCQVTVLTGERRGETYRSFNYLNSALDKDKLYAAGDVAWAMLQGEGHQLTVTLIDHYRTGIELGVVGVLAATLILFGGVIGCGAMVSLAASAVIAAVGPGTVATGMPFSWQRATSASPGSLMQGIPASVTIAPSSPPVSRCSSSGPREAALCSW